MPRALHKVQKHIAKKRGGKPNALHENSRDAKRLRQAGAREEKIARILNAATKQNQFYVDRIAWFQDMLGKTTTPLTDADVFRLTESFVSRHDEELTELKSQRRPGRPPSKAEESVQERIDTETREFKAGLWIPEMRTDESLKRFQRWSGDWAGLNSLHFVRIVKDGPIKASSFPPKSLS